MKRKSPKANHPECGPVSPSRHFINRLSERFNLPKGDSWRLFPSIIEASPIIHFHRRHKRPTLSMPGDHELYLLYGQCSSQTPVTGCYCSNCYLIHLLKMPNCYLATSIYPCPPTISL